MAAIHRMGAAPPIAPMQQPQCTQTNTRPSTTLPTMSGGYCWTHGFWVREGHFSLTCAHKAEGHKDAVTRANTMGSSMVNKGWDNKSQGGKVDAAALTHPTAQTLPLPTQKPVATTSYPRHHLPTSMPTPRAPPSELQQANYYSLRVQQPSTCRPYLQVPGMATLFRDSHTTSSVSAHYAMQSIFSSTQDMHVPRLWQINLAPPQHSLALHIARVHPTWAPTTRAQPPPTHNKKAPTETMHPLHNTDPPTTHRVHTHLRTHDLPTMRALVAFLHATAGYPVKTIWPQAIKNTFYNSWPGLTYTLVAKYCPNDNATIQGHMAQPQQHIRSTTRTTTHMPTIPALPQQAIDLFTIPLNKIFTDDTGCFHPRTRSGNQYIMIAFHADTNAILVRPFPSVMCTASPIIETSILVYPMPIASPWFIC
eukprot:CCRYP_012699-RA/>CCRYP_012699-RA protein AED:0.53 eAED:0.32 QI:0/0/0/0.66/0/0/3/0/421